MSFFLNIYYLKSKEVVINYYDSCL